jgi:hypothetical protein
MLGALLVPLAKRVTIESAKQKVFYLRSITLSFVRDDGGVVILGPFRAAPPFTFDPQEIR